MEFDINVLCLTETQMMESDHDLIKAEFPNAYSMLQIPINSCGGRVTVIYHRSFPMLRTLFLNGYHPLN